jgi:hypothetical protein
MSIINAGDVPISESQVDGTELARRLERLYAAFHSQNSNATRPPFLTAGGLWSKTATGGFDLMLYDGSIDVKIGSVINGVPDFAAGALLKTGGTMSGAINMGTNKVTALAPATANGDALGFGQAATVSQLSVDGIIKQNGDILPLGGVAPAFSAYQSTAQTLSTETYTKILFQTESFDTNNNFASSRFTPTVAGYYQVTGSLAVATTPTQIYTSIYKNGTILYYGSNPQTGTNINTGLVYCNGTTDYIEIYGRFLVGQDTFASANFTYFQGVLVRGA